MESLYSLTLHTSIPSITSDAASLHFLKSSIKPLKLAPFPMAEVVVLKVSVSLPALSFCLVAEKIM